MLESSPYRGESDELLSVSIAHHGRLFATGGSLGIMRVYDYASGKFLAEAKGHSNAITNVNFSPDDKQILSTGRDGLVIVWNCFL